MSETIPDMLAGGVLGSESGILSDMMFHGVTRNIGQRLLKPYRAAFSDAAERAATNPVFAQEIIDEAAKRPAIGNGAAIRQAIGRRAAEAVRAGIIANGLPATQP